MAERNLDSLTGLKESSLTTETVEKFHFRSDKDASPTAQHHTLGPRRNQASPGNHSHDGGTSLLLANYVPTARVQAGTVLVSFTSQTSFITSITFPVAFQTTPVVLAGIDSITDSTRWDCRAYNASTTGCSLIVYRGDGSDGAQTWSNKPVNWIAIAP